MMNWLAKRWYWFAGLLALIAFSMLGGPARKIEKLKGQRDALIKQGGDKEKAQAIQAGAQADKHQANAVEAEKATKALVKSIGGNNETVASILSDFKSGSVRKRAKKAS